MRDFCNEICFKDLRIRPAQIDVSEMESVCGEPTQSGVCIELALVVLLFETAAIEKSQRSAPI